MVKNTFHGGKHKHLYPSQQQLSLETKKPFGARLEPSIIELIQKRANERGTTASRHAGDIIKRYLELEPHLKSLQGLLDIIV